MQDYSNDLKKLMYEEFGLEDITYDTELFSSKLLDSMDVLNLMTLLESNYGVKVSPFDVTLEDFDTINLISKLVNKLKK